MQETNVDHITCRSRVGLYKTKPTYMKDTLLLIYTYIVQRVLVLIVYSCTYISYYVHNYIYVHVYIRIKFIINKPAIIVSIWHSYGVRNNITLFPNQLNIRST